jgi:hypothetical protein
LRNLAATLSKTEARSSQDSTARTSLGVWLLRGT